MSQLDLSLDIPGAPVVYRLRSSELHPDFGLAPPDEERVWPNVSRPQIGLRPAARREAVASEAPGSSRTSNGNNANANRGVRLVEDAEVRQRVSAAMDAASAAETSVVPPAATVAGDLVCRAIHIQGELRGSVEASGLVYAQEDGVLTGRVKRAAFVIVAGTVVAGPNEVAICCDGMVVLAQSARVVGHIQCRSIAIYGGARLVGTVQAFLG